MAVQTVCLMLTSKFRINVNSSCGLHVHIGHGAQVYKADELRKFFGFFWAFEPQIDLIHPSIKRDNSLYAEPLRSNTRLAKMYAERKMMSHGSWQR